MLENNASKSEGMTRQPFACARAMAGEASMQSIASSPHPQRQYVRGGNPQAFGCSRTTGRRATTEPPRSTSAGRTALRYEAAPNC